MVVVTITKVNGHTRVDAEDADHVGYVVVQINVCNLMTMEIHPMELIGWRKSSMNQEFMPSYRKNRRPEYMKYAITEGPTPLQPKRHPQWNCGYYSYKNLPVLYHHPNLLLPNFMVFHKLVFILNTPMIVILLSKN